MPEGYVKEGIEVGNWHAVLDKNSGRTYYYNDVSKKTTWDKPIQLMSNDEAASASAELKSRKDFFAEMGRNIYCKLSGAAERKNGETSSSSSAYGGKRDLMEEQMQRDEYSRDREGSTDSGNGSSGAGTSGTGSGPNSARSINEPYPMRTRTISTIDSEMMLFLKSHASSAGGGGAYGSSTTSSGGNSTGVSPRTAQAKDDGSGSGYSPRGNSSGQWSSVAASLLDPGAEAKLVHATNIRNLDEKWGSIVGDGERGSGKSNSGSGSGTGSRSNSQDYGGISILGSSPSVGKSGSIGDFDFLKEMDYLKAGFKKNGIIKSNSSVCEASDDLRTSPVGKCDSTNLSPRAIISNELKKPKLKRRNSTSTIFVSSTMEKQDNEATIKCVAVVIRAHMRSATKSMNLPSHKYDIFLDAAYRDEYDDGNDDPTGTGVGVSESRHSRGSSGSYDAMNHGGHQGLSSRLRAENKLSSTREDVTIGTNNCIGAVSGVGSYGSLAENVAQSKEVFGERSVGRMRTGSNTGQRTMAIPSMDEIESFINNVFNKSQLESECIIMSLIYCERLVKQTKGKLSIRYDNWRSITFACLVMASKVWDDLSMWNVDFSNVCSSFDLQRVNELEMAMLDIMSYRIKVSASEYAKYYFHLRSMMARLGMHQIGSNRPLDLISARKLQLATENLQSSLSHLVVHNNDGNGNSNNDGNNKDGNSNSSDNSNSINKNKLASIIGNNNGGGRNRTSTTMGIVAPGSMDRVTMNRTSSTDTGTDSAVGGGRGNANGNSRCIGKSNLFLSIDELMHSSHTNADGSNRIGNAQRDMFFAAGASSADKGKIPRDVSESK